MDCLSYAGCDGSAPSGELLSVRPVSGKDGEKVQLVRYEENTPFEDIGTLIVFGPPNVSWYVDGEVRHTRNLTAEVRRGAEGQIELNFGDGLAVEVRNLVRYQRARVLGRSNPS